MEGIVEVTEMGKSRGGTLGIFLRCLISVHGFLFYSFSLFSHFFARSLGPDSAVDLVILLNFFSGWLAAGRVFCQGAAASDQARCS